MKSDDIKERILLFLELPRTHTELTNYVCSLPIPPSKAGVWHNVWDEIIENNLVKFTGLFPIYIQRQVSA